MPPKAPLFGRDGLAAAVAAEAQHRIELGRDGDDAHRWIIWIWKAVSRIAGWHE